MKARAISLVMAVVLLLSLGVSAEAASSGNRYCYTLGTQNVRVYSDTALTKAYGWIYPSDQITVLEVHDSYSTVSYPTSNGSKTGKIATSNILVATTGNTVRASGKITTYIRPGGSSYGYISSGDNVLVLGTISGYVQVKYPAGSNYKYAVVKASDAQAYLGFGGYSGGGTSITNDNYIFVSALDNNKVIDLSGGNSFNGANVQLYEKNNTSAQTYAVISVGSGWYKIVHVASGRVLDVAGGVRSSQVNVQLFDWNGTDSQRWQFINAGNGYYYIKSKLGFMLDVSWGVASNGTNIWVYTQNNSASQKWKLVRASNSATSPTNISSVSYANYSGVNYASQTSNARRVAALDKAKRMATIQWTAPCTFPAWLSSSNVYNTVTANDGSSSTKYIQGKTYTGIPYSMSGRTYDEAKWAQLLSSGITTSSMSANYYGFSNKTTAKGIDCSYFVSIAVNAGCGSSLNLTTANMLSSSYFKKLSSFSQLRPGDVFLKSGHVMLFAGKNGSNYAVFEATAAGSKCRYKEYSASQLSAYGAYKVTLYND